MIFLMEETWATGIPAEICCEIVGRSSAQAHCQNANFSYTCDTDTEINSTYRQQIWNYA